MTAKLFYITQIASMINMAYLSYIHYNVKFGSMSKSLCNINDFINCDLVNTSLYSLFLNVPVSLWSLILNFVLLIFGFKGLSQLTTDAAKRAAFLSVSIMIAAFSVLGSIVMAWISFVIIKGVCLFCILAYILSILSLVLLTINKPFKLNKILENVRANKCLIKVSIYIGIGFVLGFVVNDVVKKNMLGRQIKTFKFSLMNWQTAKRHNFDTTGALKLASNKNPKMTIVEFADFQCIHCKNASGPIKNFAQSKQDVHLVFMPYPLDGICNETIPAARDGASCKFAYATHCANQQDKGWQMHDYLFEDFGKIKTDELSDRAAKFGLDQSLFNLCMESPDTKTAIMNLAKQADAAGIAGTPAVYVNGKKLDGGASWFMLDKVYDTL